MQYKNILKNREQAALKLKDVIPMQRLKEENWKIIAVSKGGLEIAWHLKGKYTNEIDFLFTEAIYAPNNDECEIARVSESEEIVIHEKLVDAFEINYDYIYGEAHRKHEEKILGSIYKYRKGRRFVNVKGEFVLLVDEASETGSRFLTALKTILAQKPKAVYVAVPILPTDVVDLLEPFCDDVYFLYALEDYIETPLYYEELGTLSEEKIEKYLENKRNEV
ncbi:MAG: phosphoribosyltransferase family protein [Sulfurimonadaceae bacterium]|jgi:putative phosphoribosyl transferase|nr:phosphoribosyltransferase family protein [Sulfurimonadaceae bacterium]